MKIILLFFVLIYIASAGIAQTTADVQKIKSKLYQISLDRALPVEMGIDLDASQILKSITDDGNWADINYNDKSASKWMPSNHLKRTYELSVHYRDPKSPFYGKLELRNSIIKALQFWINNPPQATNWWWNQIGAPNLLGGIFVLMESELDESLKEKGVELMKLGVKPEFYFTAKNVSKATGQNALWIASAHTYASVISNDIEGLKCIFSTVAEEIMVSQNEGIQPDFSFYQHGRQNYAFGYGKGFTETAAKYLFLADKTAFQFSPEKIEIISNYLLQGQQWMSRYSFLEYTAMGREISRQKITITPLLSSLTWLMDVDPNRAGEYKSFYNRLSDDKKEKSLVGNRYFWRSDLIVHHRANYYFSLKGTSNRILSGESGNGENLKGWYQGNGTFYLVRTGKEYHEIFPVWDWRKLPGSLCAQKSESLPLFQWGEGAQGATAFVYGLSDGLYGCFGYDYNKDKVTARRAWFLFDNEIVNLVSNACGDSLYQSINQCLLNGKVWSGLKNKQGNVDRIFHDSVGYCIDSPDKLELKTRNKTGAWTDINTSESAKPLSKKVFSLGINLGNKVVDSSYSYTILPAMGLEQFKKYKLKAHLSTLQNTNELQAVFQKDIQQVQAVFYSAGKLQLPWNKLSLTMKHAGLIILKKSGNKLLIDYCQPTDKKYIEVDVHSKTEFKNNEIVISK